MDTLRSHDYEYEHDDFYCYPGSPVLKNKLNITDGELLETAERDITYLRALEAAQKHIPGHFDYAHLKRIHRFLFGDVYDWAGQTRLVNISKGNPFCQVPFIDAQMDRISTQLKKENYLKDLKDRTMIAKRLAYYLGEINAVHPFREGNGRAQRMFIEHLAHTLGYRLDFSKISREDMILASSKAFVMDYAMLENLIENILEEERNM